MESVYLSSYVFSQKTKKEKNNFLYTKNHSLLKIQNKSLMVFFQWLKPLKINFPKQNSYKQIIEFDNKLFILEKWK